MAEQPVDYLAVLCAKFGLEAAALVHVPPAVLEEAVSEIWAETADRLKAHIAIGRARPKADKDDETLRQYFSEKERREQEPWLLAAARAKTQTDSMQKAFAEPRAWENLRETFLARSKAGLFSPLEGLCLQYLVFGASGGWSCYFLAALLVNVPPPARLAVHNWAVAAEMSEAVREANGPAIAALSAPLFPPGRGFDELNARLLASLPRGGGQQMTTGGGVYAEPLQEGLWERPRRAGVTGGGALPLRGPGGQQTAELETGPLEAELAGIRAQLAQLAARGRGRGGARGRWGPPPYQQQGQPQHHQQQGYGQQGAQHNQQQQQGHQQQGYSQQGPKN